MILGRRKRQKITYEEKRTWRKQKEIIIKNDLSLPELACIKMNETEGYREQRVKVFGWVHRLHGQGKNLMFLVL